MKKINVIEEEDMKVETYDQVSSAPTNKVAAAGIGGSVAVVLVWLAGMFGIEVPPEVAAAVTTLISFFSGYLVKEKRLVA
jgi:hypothetical protein